MKFPGLWVDRETGHSGERTPLDASHWGVQVARLWWKPESEAAEAGETAGWRNACAECWRVQGREVPSLTSCDWSTGECDLCGAGRPAAVLPSTILPMDGTYKVRTLISGDLGDRRTIMAANLAGVPSYVGHPATAAILKTCGVVQVSGLWTGMQIGQSAIVVSLRPHKEATARSTGYTVDQKDVSPDDLVVRLLTRLA